MSKLSRVVVLPLLITILMLYLSHSILEYRMIGTNVAKDASGQYVVQQDTPAGLWGYKRILAGDIIEKVDGKSPSSFFYIKNYNAIEGASTISIIRTGLDGAQQEINLVVDKGIASENLMLEFIVPFCSVLLFAGFSWFVYRRKQKDKAAIYLILFFLSTGLAYFSSFSSGRLNPVGILTFNFTFSLVPIFFLQFLNQYLKRYEEPLVPRGLFVALYCVVTTILSLLVIRMLTGFDFYFFAGVPLILPFFIIVNLYIIYKLIEKFVRHRRDYLRTLFKFTLIGHIIGFLPFILLFGMPQLVGVNLIPSQVASIFLLGIPIVYLYMFMNRQLFDIDFLLNRFLYFTIISFIPTLLITTFGMLILSRHDFSWVKGMQMFLVVYLMLTLFLFSKEYADFRLRPNFNKDLYNFQGSLDRFSTRISRVMKRADLERVLEQEILSTLLVKRMAFLEVSKERVYASQSNTGTKGIHPSVISALQNSVHQLTVGEPVTVPYGLCIVMGHKGSTFHVLWLDDKENQTKYNLDELGWLKTLANYTAIVYENLYLIESLIEDLELEFQKQKGASPWVMRLIFNLSEIERRRLAADLHDSALQDQLIWYRKLESVMLDHAISAELYQELEMIHEGLLDVIHQIRETCNEMRPPLLKEMGIVEALGHLFEQTQIRSNYAIDFRVKRFTAELNDEQTLALFRIVQELLRNASKHASASTVIIELEQRETIRLLYKDNGIGMELVELSDSYQHMGLSGIKERVRSLEGEIDFQSVVGEGLEISISLPLESVSTAMEGKDESDDKYLVG